MATKTFHPALWLNDFEQKGGAFALCHDRLCLFIVPGDRDESELSTAREMITSLSDTERGEVAAELRVRTIQPARDASDWDAAVDHWRGLRRLEETHPSGSMALDDPRKVEIEADYHATFRRSQSALRTIITTPAQSISAVADKLALIIEDDPDNADLAVLKPIETDCRRLAGGSATPLTDPVARYWNAFHAHNEDLLDEDGYFEAFEAMWDWTPTTPTDFIRKFEAAYSVGGCPTKGRQESLVQVAEALLGRSQGRA